MGMCWLKFNLLAPLKWDWNWIDNFQTYIMDRYFTVMNTTTRPHWRLLVNIGSGNGGVSSGTKPLPKSMLTTGPQWKIINYVMACCLMTPSYYLDHHLGQWMKLSSHMNTYDISKDVNII